MNHSSKKIETALLLAIAITLPLQAMAGAGGTEFTQVYDQLTGWANGTLGKVLGVSALLVGLGVGVIKQSVIAAVVGIAMALTAGFGPGVIDGVVSSGVAIVNPI
ncbi:TraA family conjugative transfer protein [Acidovorax delafieldii]|jgi:conjugal transfer pilus assembly protein TraA|uniref:TraA family conjugative transfer protein n=1 Tax=Acidovorax delafieldii TaxID=47920 RepID=UPI003ECCE101